MCGAPEANRHALVHVAFLPRISLPRVYGLASRAKG